MPVYQAEARRLSAPVHILLADCWEQHIPWSLFKPARCLLCDRELSVGDEAIRLSPQRTRPPVPPRWGTSYVCLTCVPAHPAPLTGSIYRLHTRWLEERFCQGCSECQSARLRYQEIRRWAAEEGAICPHCDGTGRITGASHLDGAPVQEEEDELDVLPNVTRNCLVRNGLSRADDVRAATDAELLLLRNFGVGSLREARARFPHDPSLRAAAVTNGGPR